ncbi:type III secretion system YscD/HrpQ family protein [Luteimonas cucumeris]|uniref:Type III secretion system YscD/HrpQ family protein n=1 Tax=Luteimonas cucumeris TaxID=985012 RepID=A0A562KVF7_9GAMM|nr:type III secretion system inner membrane ring subunit SctD [Luteimonas cucumeris]TWH99401.1 type III secretion system YscD/HrpQ family protein [Luteimonas cucumeris]
MTQSPPPQAPQPTPAANAGTHALRILSGLHVGASRDLAEKEMILVGSGDDCDIVLSDPGVAPHHALIGLHGGSCSVRALDAPLRIGGQPLHPGDPVELATLQRIELGQAAFAIGASDDPGWASLLPMHDGRRAAPAPAPYMKRLPAVAAFAVLSLMSVAILAAVMPRHDPAPQPSDSLARLIPEFGIADGRASVDANGIQVLSGTVKDAATRDRIRVRLQKDGISASLDLRTGEDIANDVQDILRTQGFATRTRYLGNGDVEVSGNFEDGGALEKAVKSRAMVEVDGVRRIVPRNYEPIDPFQTVAAPSAKKEAAKPAVSLVSVVRGKEPHVLGSDGSKFGIGEKLPDGSTLIGIGSEYASALDSAGQLQRVQLAPPPAAETPPAPADAAATTVAAKPTATGNVSAAPAAPATAAPAPQVAKAKPSTAKPAQRM